MVRRLVAERPANFQSAFLSCAPTTFSNWKGTGGSPLVQRVRARAREHEHHQPHVFGVMSLPAFRVSGSLYLDTLLSVEDGVVSVVARRDQIWMPVVILVFGKRTASVRDRGGHKLAHNAAEVRGHEEVFKSGQLPLHKLLVQEVQEIHEGHHRVLNMLYFKAVRYFRSRVEGAIFHFSGTKIGHDSDLRQRPPHSRSFQREPAWPA